MFADALVALCCSALSVATFLWTYYQNLKLAAFIVVTSCLVVGFAAMSSRARQWFCYLCLKLKGFYLLGQEESRIFVYLLENPRGLIHFREFENDLPALLVEVDGLPCHQFAVLMLNWPESPVSCCGGVLRVLSRPRIDSDELKLFYFEKVLCS